MKLATIVMLFLLLAGEVYIGLVNNGDHLPIQYILEYGLEYALITGAPIAVVIAAVRAGPRPSIAIGCAWTDIVVGTFIQIGFHQSHDPSKVIILAISILTYWLCGLIALVSFLAKRP